MIGYAKVSYKRLWINTTQGKKCPYLEFSWFVFFGIRTEYRDLLCISPYAARMREITNQKNSEYETFSCSARDLMTTLSK